GSNFWAVLVFFTLVVLGFSSAFVMVDVVATLVVDSGLKVSRPIILTTLILISFLLCLPYCTQSAYYRLNCVDKSTHSILLSFVVWSESVGATSVYRWSDVFSQTGLPAFILYTMGYFGGQIAGVAGAHGGESPAAGAGAGVGLDVVCPI